MKFSPEAFRIIVRILEKESDNIRHANITRAQAIEECIRELEVIGTY